MKSHLSAVHTGLETPYTPAVPLFSPPPHPAAILHRMSMVPFWKKKGEREGIERNKEATAGWACFIGFGGTVRTAVTAVHESQLKPRLSFFPFWFLGFTLVSLYHLQ